MKYEGDRARQPIMVRALFGQVNTGDACPLPNWYGPHRPVPVRSAVAAPATGWGEFQQVAPSVKNLSSGVKGFALPGRVGVTRRLPE